MLKYSYLKQTVYSFALRLCEMNIEVNGVKGSISLSDLSDTDISEFAGLLLTSDREMDFLTQSYEEILPLISNSLREGTYNSKIDVADAINKLAIKYFQPEMEEVLNYAHLEAVSNYISENNLRTSNCTQTGEMLYHF